MKADLTVSFFGLEVKTRKLLLKCEYGLFNISENITNPYQKFKQQIYTQRTNIISS
jgi:hypothetical protein